MEAKVKFALTRNRMEGINALQRYSLKVILTLDEWNLSKACRIYEERQIIQKDILAYYARDPVTGLVSFAIQTSNRSGAGRVQGTIRSMTGELSPRDIGGLWSSNSTAMESYGFPASMECSIYVLDENGALPLTAYSGEIALDRVMRIAFITDEAELEKIQYKTNALAYYARVADEIPIKHFYPRLLENVWVAWNDEDKTPPSVREHNVYNPFELSVIDDLSQEQASVVKA
jgi:hypothetical protein